MVTGAFLHSRNQRLRMRKATSYLETWFTHAQLGGGPGSRTGSERPLSQVQARGILKADSMAPVSMGITVGSVRQLPQALHFQH